MPQKIEAITFVDDPSRSLEQLQIACREAGLDDRGSAETLRERLQHYLKNFTDGDEIVCLNPGLPTVIEIGCYCAYIARRLVAR